MAQLIFLIIKILKLLISLLAFVVSKHRQMSKSAT